MLANIYQMDKKCRIIIILCCIAITLLLAGYGCRNIESQPSSKTENDSTQILQLIQTGDNLYESNPDSAISLYDQALGLAAHFIGGKPSNSDSYQWGLKQIALSHRGIGVSNTAKGELQKSLDEINIALSYVSQYETSNPDAFAKDYVAILNSKGVVQKRLGFFKDALETYHLAQTIASKHNDSLSVAIFLTNAGNIYQEIGDTDKALEYINNALELHTKLKNQRGIIATNLTLANILNTKGELEKARPHYIAALNFCIEQNLHGYVGLIQSNLGVLEMKLENFQLALDFFNNAIVNLNKVGNRQGLALVYGNLADLHIGKGEYSKGIEFAKKQLAEAKQTQGLVNQRYAYKHLSKAYSGLGNYKLAYENQLLYTSLNDSIMSVEKRKEISRLEAVYQDEKKREEIKYLENLSTLLANKNRLQGIMLVSISLLLITTVLLTATWVRNSKLKANRKQLMLEHKLLRLQMNPHFLFNSLSSIQNVIIRSDKMEAATLVANFSKFIRFVLDSSRSNLVPLDNEIEAINIFLDLQKVRFPNLFTHTINIDIDEDSSEVLVPPLIIQPFVENSVIHGFPKDKNDGKLDIHFFKSNGNLCCRVKDNGVGFTSNIHKKEGTHTSLATQITAERLELISKRYKCKATLVYEDMGDNAQGTSLIITLPLLFNDIEN